MKITTIYVDIRPDTTGFYVDRALKSLGHEVAHVNPLAKPIPQGQDFYLMVDDGIDYSMEGVGNNLIYWAIDTHFSPEQSIKKAKNANYVFAAQLNGLEVLPNAQWLPLGCDEEIHSSQDNKKEYDICFIGNTYNKSMTKRIEYLDKLFKEFPNFYYGKRFFKDASNIYGRSKIVFNCSLNNDINMRVFEAMCSGSLLVTDTILKNGFDELQLVDGKNIVTYDDDKELINKVKYYLVKENEREKIAIEGKKFALENTYKKRMETMFKLIEKNVKQEKV